MTDQIRRTFQRMLDHANRLLDAGELTSREYSEAVQDITDWVDFKIEQQKWVRWPQAED